MTTSRFRIVFLASLLFFSATIANAQTPAPVTQLAVEIQYYPGPLHAHIVVDGTEKHGIWFGRFGRVPGWVSPANSLPVTAVNIKAQQAEGGVRIWVSVFLGKVHEEEKQISSYVLREGDAATANELADVGVVPFEFKVVRVAASAAYVPEFKSKSPAIELASIQSTYSASPAIQLVLRNVSSMPVHALEVLTISDGVPCLAYMPQGKEGDVLIPPGGTVEVKTYLKSTYTASANERWIQTLPNQSIEVATAVFADGSSEGESDYALTFLGYQKGRKAQLARVIDLLDKAGSETSDAASLKDKLLTLNLDADPAAIQELQQQFPQEKRIEHIKTAIQVGMHDIRDEVMKDVIEFQMHNRYAKTNAFNSWVISAKQRYQAWLNRL